MIDFYFDTAAAEDDAAAALSGLSLDATASQPVFGARQAQNGVPPKVLFANRAMLALFGAANLERLTERLLLAGDPGAKRLQAIAQKPVPAARPRLERLRFYFGAATHVFTFACRWSVSGAKTPLFAAAVLDAPAYLLNPEHTIGGPVAEPVPTASAPPAIEKPDAPLSLPGGKAVRFLWRTDAEDRFMEVAPPLRHVVGTDSADIIGRTVQQVSALLHLDPDDELANAFAGRKTWSGIEVKWPVAGKAMQVPVSLGALPIFDHDRRFEGFHGFGVIYADRAEASANPVGVQGTLLNPPLSESETPQSG